ncbi:MAG: cytochrome P450 [Chloroflexi bacterium]|nr:cytochrome P450 [Chloroflexota bacterium]
MNDKVEAVGPLSPVPPPAGGGTDWAREWDPLAPGTFDDPAATYAEMRARCPVAQSDRWGGFWALTRYDDVVAVAADYETFTTAVQNLVPRSPRSGVARRPLQVDPPEHAQFRRAMNPYFEVDRVALLEPTLREVAARFLQPLLDRGAGDLAEEWARHLPIRAVCALLRVPEGDAEWIQSRSRRYVASIASDPETANRLSGELDDYARRLVATRRASPIDAHLDIVSGLLEQGIGGRPVGDEVVASFVRGLIVAADRSTTHGISNGALHLARDPRLQEYLRQHPGRLPDAIEELVRLYAPSHATARTATRDVELGGCPIKQGDPVALVWMAANRDPEVFPDPDTFDMDRRPNRHVGFGHGIHKCGGQTVARLQLRVALEVLLGSTSHFEVVGPVAYQTWPEYGPNQLPVRLVQR